MKNTSVIRHTSHPATKSKKFMCHFLFTKAVIIKPGVHTNDFAPIHGRRARIHTAPEEDNTSNQQSTPQVLCEYGRGDRESGRNR